MDINGTEKKGDRQCALHLPAAEADVCGRDRWLDPFLWLDLAKRLSPAVN